MTLDGTTGKRSHRKSYNHRSVETTESSDFNSKDMGRQRVFNSNTRCSTKYLPGFCSSMMLANFWEKNPLPGRVINIASCLSVHFEEWSGRGYENRSKTSNNKITTGLTNSTGRKGGLPDEYRSGQSRRFGQGVSMAGRGGNKTRNYIPKQEDVAEDGWTSRGKTHQEHN